MHSKIRFIITSILISIAFFLFAKIDLKIAFIQSNITLIWLPSGLSLPVLLFGGYKYLPAVSIGAFFTTYSTGAPIGFVIATAIGNSLEPLFSAYFLKSRLENNKYPLSLKNVGLFFLIAIIIAPTISALIGVLGLCLNGMVEWNFFYSISLGWWAGNAFGVLTLGAFVFAWLSNANISHTKSTPLEGFILFILLTLTQTIIYFDIVSPNASLPLTWTAFPFLIWTSIRFNHKIAVTFTCITISIAVLATINGKGPLFTGSINPSLYILYGFCSIVMLNSMILAAISSERFLKEKRLARNNELLKQTEEIARIGSWELDTITKERTWTDEIFSIHEVPITKSPLSTEEAILFYPLPGRLTLQTAMLDAIEKGIPYNLELPFITKSGKSLWIQTQCRIIKSNNKVVRLIGTFQDITLRKETETELIKTKEAAEAANQAKSDFLANISHELRTPLNSVIALTDLLLKSKLNESQEKNMGIVFQSANSLLDLLNSILDYSKIESGELALKIEKLNLIELVNQAINTIRSAADDKNISILISLAKNLPTYIWIDSARLRQILINLLINAIKFTNAGSVEIIIEVLKFDSSINQMQILFSVIDTGIGISEEHQKRIFEAFTQADSSTSRRYKGIGLGLSISNTLLRLMNSKLRLESELDKGSRFYFILETKIEYENIQEDAKYSMTNENYNSFFPDLTNISKILVVDDDTINLFLVRTIIQELLPNSNLIEATNGKEAIDIFQKENPDLIILDIQMPEMNGLEATIEIRKLEKEKRTPIIALTAGTMKGDKEKCLSIGMDDYACKPFVKYTIAKLLYKWLFNQ